MSQDPFAAPPSETPGALPPNRVPPPSGRRMLGVWLFLALFILAAWHIAGGPLAAPSPAALAPLLLYASMLGGLVLLRAQLPARYRTGELRELPRAAPPEAPAAPPTPHAPPPPLELTVLGTDGSHRVRLHLHDGGLSWHTEPRLLEPARELHVTWPELEGLSTGHTSGGYLAWSAVLVGMSWALRVHGVWIPVLGSALALGLWLLDRRRPRGYVTLTTATHVLTLTSRTLDHATTAQILEATRARRPTAVPAPAAATPGVLRMLVLEPWRELARALAPTDRLRAELVRSGMTTADPELVQVSTVQHRMFGLWSGVMRGAGPAAWALSLGLVGGHVVLGLGAWSVSFLVGLVVVTRSTATFARFSGMSVLR